MTLAASCPDRVRLQGLVHGTVGTEEEARLIAHLDSCAACRETLEALSGEEPRASEVASRVAGPPEPALEKVVSKLQEQADDRNLPCEAAGEDELHLAFLAPPAEPGHLGRLAHFEVLEVVGRGGMGVVLKARDEPLDRIVAIKVMAPQLATSATARQRFLREARAAAAIRDEHVITIHAVDEVNGLPYMVMEYVNGISLQQRLDLKGPIELREVLRIGIQAARGLAAAHAQGLVHRDVKPANILLENGVERVKLTDFGLARAADDASLTQSGVVVGTPEYMSPEQGRGEAIDRRTDLFSLGSVLYTMCTGRPPFRAPTALAVLKRVCEDTPRPIREINPDIPDWLVKVIARLHAKNPADRFQSAAEVANLLGEYLAHLQQPTLGTSPQIPPGGVGFSARDPTRGGAAGGRAPKARWLVAVAVLVALGGLVLTEALGMSQLTPTLLALLRRERPQEHKEPAAIPEQRSAPQSPRQQVERVVARLKALNPGFDGKIRNLEFDGNAVVSLAFYTDAVTDITPLQELPDLRRLNCSGSAPGRGVLSDLTPLRGLKLVSFHCQNNPVTDLSPLRGMPLTIVDVYASAVTSVAPLVESPLTELVIGQTQVTDLTPVARKSLVYLNCQGAPLADLTPLKHTSLQRIHIDFDAKRDAAVLHALTTLKEINGKSVAAFWKETDKK